MGYIGEDMKRKRKLGGEEENTELKKKKKLKGVLQFIDDAAVADHNEPSDDEIFEEECGSDSETNNELKVYQPFAEINGNEEHDKMLEDYYNGPSDDDNELQVYQPFVEMNDDEEHDKMPEDYYTAGSGLVTIAEYGDNAEPRMVYSAEDPTVWKVKCVVGREKHSAFCLMQKYVDLKALGTELQIISVFALDHVRGFIFVEAYKEWQMNEACKGICNIYCNNVYPVPENELLQLLHVRSKRTEISSGMWVRLKGGKYKGDLAKVVALNKSHKKATVKLVPRIDLQVLAEKFGRGVRNKKTTIPRARLISSKELDDFRPLIKHKRDRDLGEVFEVLDGMMFKDGYLYKKVQLDSLMFWGSAPSENELMNFEQSGGDRSKDLEWLDLLYGEHKTALIDNQSVRGDCSRTVCSYQVHDLVFFGSCSQEHFGVIIAVEEAGFKILKEDCEAPLVVTIKQDQLRKAFFSKKLTALDRHMKVVSVNDNLRVLEGPFKDRQGDVKHLYRGTVFLQDKYEPENNGYICCRTQNCENLKTSVNESDSKGVVSQVSVSEKLISSLQSPVLENKRSNSNPKVESKDVKFSIGQSLRIRVGPLKGYLCRAMAIQESNVTVKLDSQNKILTVECEKLCVPGEKKSVISKGGNGVPGPLKSSNLLGIRDGTKGRFNRVGMSVRTAGMKRTAGLSNRRMACPSVAVSTSLLRRTDSGFAEQSRGVKKRNSVIVRTSSWRGGIKKPMGFGGWRKKEEEIMIGRGGGVRRSSAAVGRSQPPLTFRGQQTSGSRGRGRAGGGGGWKGGAQSQAPSDTCRKQVGIDRGGAGTRGGRGGCGGGVGGRGGVRGRGGHGGGRGDGDVSRGGGVCGFGSGFSGGRGGICGGRGGGRGDGVVSRGGGVCGRGSGFGSGFPGGRGGITGYRGGFDGGRGKSFGGSGNSNMDQPQRMDPTFKQNVYTGGRGRGRASFPRGGFGQRNHATHNFRN